MLAARPQGGQFVCIAGKYLEGGGLPSALGDSRQWASFAVGLGYQQVGKRRRRRTMGQPNNEAFGAIGRRSAGRQRCGETASRPASGRVWTVRPLVQPVPSGPPVAPDPGSRGSTRCSRQLSSASPARFAGAESLVLDGVYHSPLGAADGRPWYGSPGVLEQWESFVIPSASGRVQSAAP